MSAVANDDDKALMSFDHVNMLKHKNFLLSSNSAA
jgi:hypothetical protein